MTCLIKGGRVIDPLNKVDGVYDILISGGKVDKIDKDLSIKAANVIDAKGKIVAPGLVDMHVHLRQPGREDKETVLSGTRAAIRGGFTSIVCMPNTEPAIDRPDAVRMLKNIIKNDAACNVLITGAVTMGRAGVKLTDFDRMQKEGIVAISDDGACIQDKGIMLEALKGCKKHSILFIDHCENTALSTGGVMNKGFVSTKMGLRGMPRQAEYEIVKRDLELAKKASARIHIAHVSCKESIEAIRKAKRDGVNVTSETAPHYFVLNEECCVTYDTNTKMNPPLRAREDVGAIKEALADGTIDVIATDHAPHTDAEKYVEFDFAPFGIIGLETALPIGAMELVEKKVLDWPGLILKMSANPARILKIDKGGLKKGCAADMVIIDPTKEYIYTKDSIESKSKNSPFIDWRLKAKVSYVFIAGRILMQDGIIADEGLPKTNG